MRLRIFVGLLFILLSGTILVSHETDAIFPWWPLALFGVSILLLVARIEQWVRTSVAALTSSGYVAYVFAFAHPSLIGRDPDKVAVAVSRVIEFQGVEGLSGFYFYASIPGFHLFTAGIAQVLGISGKQALILLGISTPLFLVPSAVLLARSWSTPEAPKYASVIVMVSTPALYYSLRPIPQLFAIILWPSFLVLFDGYVQKDSNAHFVGLSIVSVALMYSHKLPLVVVLGASLAAVGVELIRTRWIQTTNVRKYMSLSILFGILLVLQQIWLTDFFRAATTSIIPGLFDEQAGAPGDIGVQNIQAVRLLPRPLEIVAGNMDWLLFTFLAGIGWCVLLWWMRKRETNHTVLLGAAAISGLFIVFTYLITAVSTKRVALFAVVPFGVVIALSLSALSSVVPRHRRKIVGPVIILLVISQLGVAAATPDYPYGTREFLTQQEVDGKRFSNQYATESVTADFEYAREIVDYDRPDQVYITGANAVARGYTQVSERYLNSTVSEQGYPYILYRPHYDRYRSTYPWRLTWDPESEFDGDYHRVFDNGGAILYRNNGV